MANYEFWDELNKIVNAVNAYQDKSIEFNRRFINPWLGLGGVFGSQKQAKEAAEVLLKNIALDPQNADTWFELGLAQLRAGELDEAQQAFTKTIELHPEHAMAYLHLGHLHLNAGRLQDAELACLHALDFLSEVEDKKNAWNLLGDIFRKQNQYEKAFTAYQQADALLPHEESQPSLAEDPAEPEVDPLILSEAEEARFTALLPDDKVYFDEDDDSLLVWDEAILEDADPIAWEEVIEDVNPRAMQIPESKAMEEPASTPMEDVVALDDVVEPRVVASPPESPVIAPEVELSTPPAPQEELPGWLMDEPRPEPLATEVEETTAEEPAAQEVADLPIPLWQEEWSEIAWSHETNLAAPETTDETAKDQPSAQEASHVSDVLQEKVGVTDANVWNELGVVYFNSGALDNAVAAFNRAMEIDPTLAWPYSNLALVYVQQKKLEEALPLYQRSIELFSDDIDKAISWNRLGNVYRLMNDHDNAIASYQRADELDPVNVTLAMQSRYSLLGSALPAMEPISG